MKFLEEKISAFDAVKDRVTSLEGEVSRIHAQLDQVNGELQTQEEIIEKLMRLDADNSEESSDDGDI